MTQAELDAEYDVERSVPDFMVHARHFIDESKLARHRVNCRLDVAYGPTLDEHLDLFPARRGPAPVVVFFHGGYWRMLSSKDFSMAGLGPAALGAAVANVNYSLCPKVAIDEIVRQARAAVAWTHAHAADFGGDPDRIFVAGHSAGAHLAAMTLATDWAGDYGLPDDTIKGALLVSGLYDLRPLPYCFVQPALQLTADQVQRNSPMLSPPLRRDLPVIVSWGGAEPAEFRRQSEDFLTAWQRAGNPGEPLCQAEANHFTALYGMGDADSVLCRALARLMGLARPSAGRR